MSDLFEAIKDALNPKRREQATAETYDPHTRGPYPDRPPAGGSQAQPEPRPRPRAASAAQREGAQGAGSSGSTAAGEESTASHGVGGYGGAAAKPLHTEGSNYGLS
ncbi:uncharacterized protein P884DRAFT_252169 [Thermothelomyces heterothallicus CBS 202.75]|uniref:uncharacterized protein n=1 Tax=Thermothelomyces heterothallicus CBS 202.75 TaxID=1149848 RepID=UPI003744A13D